MQLFYRAASAGRGTARDDAVDFREIVGREHDVRNADILLKVLARFRASTGTMKATPALGHWPSNGKLGEP
ncbi:hypothetical protein [Bradyrhizobium sp.]|uniref:hypothetical protein n=1 Tax=Bradyrhizobium sp. TaxID=376 RepID=UPI001ECF8E26|nr:hypothetical protein [Bradyrhizobium sp.]MBV9979994.1 hypothetical protein [Bradyrhizobium sp.]